MTGLAVLMTALASAPPEVAGQSLLWAGYGRNSDDATRVATGETFRLGYGIFRLTSGLTASVGLPADPDASSRWATAAGWIEPAPPGPVTLTAGGSVFGFDDPILGTTGAGSLLTLDARTALDLGPAELRLSAGGRHGAVWSDGAGSQRLLGRAGTAVGVRTGLVEAWAELDHWRAEEGGYTQAGGRLGLFHPRVQAWAGVAHWLDAALPGTGWDVGLRVPVSERVALTARGGVPAHDILFWVPRQRTWSVAVQLRTGAARTVAALPVPVHDARRAVTLTLPDEGIEGRPSVAGSFSDWRPVFLDRARGGWRLELLLEPGVHEYAFVTEDGTWFVPDGTPGRKPDGFGGHVAVLIVQ